MVPRFRKSTYRIEVTGIVQGVGFRPFIYRLAHDEETFSSELIMRRDEQIVKAVFKKAEAGAIGGVIRHTVDNQVKETSLYFVRVVKEENKLILKINGQEVVVAISGPLNNGHFVNPTYTAVINGETVSYALEGEACYSFSFHLAAMIMGAYVH